MPRHIPARPGFPEQWEFEPPDLEDFRLAVSLRRTDPGRFIGIIHSPLIRFLVRFERGPRFPKGEAWDKYEPRDDGTEYMTAWVSLTDFRDELANKRPSRTWADIARKYLALPPGSIRQVVSITLANG